MYKLFTILSLIIISTGCAKNIAPDVYTLVRPETIITNNSGFQIIKIALYEKSGDSNYVYFKNTSGKFVQMSK